MSRERKRLDRGSKSKQKDFINISNTRTYVYTDEKDKRK